MTDGLQVRSYLEELDCLGTVLLVKTGGGGRGLREFSMVDGFVADGLVEAEKHQEVCECVCGIYVFAEDRNMLRSFLIG